MHALDVLKYGNLTLPHAVRDLPEADWQTPNVCGYWSVREIIAHLASFGDLPEADWQTPNVCGHWSVREIIHLILLFVRPAVSPTAGLTHI